MLLTETIVNSTSAIKKRKSMQANKKAAEDFANALGRLARVSQAIKTTIDCAEEMQSSGIVKHPPMKQQVRDELLDFADGCGRGVFEGTLTMDMVVALKAKGDIAAEQMKVVWKESATKYAEGTKGYLSMIGGLTDDPKYAKELAERITKTVDGALTTANVKKLVADVAEAKQIADAFSLNPEIEAFLKKVSSLQATVVDLTPNILAWLKEKKLTSKLRIRF